MSAIDFPKCLTVALLAHDEPALAALLVEKFIRAGAARVVLFDGSGRGVLCPAILEAVPEPFRGAVTDSGWSQRIRHGNLMPYKVAAFAWAHENGADAIMTADSDLVPVRADAVDVLMRLVGGLEKQHRGRAVVVSSWVTSVHRQSGYLGASQNYPAKCFMQSAALGLNPLAPVLRSMGWNGDFVVGTFNPGTVFNAAAIKLAVGIFAQVPALVFESLNAEIVFAAEEVFLQTALEIAGCVYHCPAGYRGVRWRPAWASHERIAEDLLFVHPVPRSAAHPLWSDGNPTPSRATTPKR